MFPDSNSGSVRNALRLLTGSIFMTAAITATGPGAAQAAPDPAGATAERAAGAIPHGLMRAAAAPAVIPIPILFVANEVAFTPTGEETLLELIEAAKEVRTMKLVGHAAARGTSEANMELSRRRVIAVRDRLVLSGATARITIEWKGDHEPFDVSVLPDTIRLDPDDILQLNDRVEWVPELGQE
jgi:outer membrane protein OmpA-like peptidoglycan-associated protein